MEGKYDFPPGMDREGMAEELERLLSLEDGEELEALFLAAYERKVDRFGKRVHLRGLIEISNICDKDCYYCGIRRSNHAVKRYRIAREDILRMCRWAYEQHYGSVVLQSGEQSSPGFIDFIEELLRDIVAMSGGDLGVTLCLGEQGRESYRRWREAGARRYLLRMESSDPLLYRQIHPPGHDFDRRLECLMTLRELGYQTGTGVMTGLPGQTARQLADDLLFFRDYDFDMIGMGPYIPHHQTPLGADGARFDAETRFRLGLKMTACARLLLDDVNIAATTALQALDPRGRERGLLAGANILMPNITDVVFRENYQLYDNKPCLDENSTQCRNCLERRVVSIGETIAWDEPGDPPHYFRRRGNLSKMIDFDQNSARLSK